MSSSLLYIDSSLRASYLGVAPFLVFNPSDPSSPSGADVDVMRFLRERLDFSVAFRPERSFGEPEDQGTTGQGGQFTWSPGELHHVLMRCSSKGSDYKDTPSPSLRIPL